ncbi:hypothetical protein AGMMS49957_16580 [Synergistales bacterium]|nr:hypothetical protein AGMMS49957_16580 [Synergistales bacterium]
MQEIKPRIVKRYKRRDGREPFAEWLGAIEDKNILKKVLARIERVKLGYLGEHRFLEGDLFELKFESGIRIYCANLEDIVVVLLCAGGKNTKGDQSRDIARAQRYWADFMEQES